MSQFLPCVPTFGPLTDLETNVFIVELMWTVQNNLFYPRNLELYPICVRLSPIIDYLFLSNFLWNHPDCVIKNNSLPFRMTV